MSAGKILVVDDETRIVDILDKFLTRKGFEVEKAYDGEKGLGILKKDKSIDLIILDEKMPNMSGTAMCKEMEKLKINVPIIILTGSLSLLDAKDLRGISYDHVLIKPIRLSELMKLLEKILTGSRKKRT